VERTEDWGWGDRSVLRASGERRRPEDLSCLQKERPLAGSHAFASQVTKSGVPEVAWIEVDSSACPEIGSHIAGIRKRERKSMCKFF